MFILFRKNNAHKLEQADDSSGADQATGRSEDETIIVPGRIHSQYTS